MKKISIKCVTVGICMVLFAKMAIAQQNDTTSFFPLGLWGIWIDQSKPPFSRDLNQNEWNKENSNWQNIKGNYLVYWVPYWVEDSVMNFCDQNNYRMDIANFHYWAHGKSSDNLYDWLHENDITDSSAAISIIQTLKNKWQNHAGFYTYSFGQEWLEETWRYPLIEFLGRKIHELDPQRKSYYIAGGGAPPTGFIDVVPSLDILQVDGYEFHTDQLSTYSAQQQCIDNMLFHYNTILNQFKYSATNKHTEWQVIIQAHRENRNGCSSLRRPNIYELRAQAFLALSRGARGVTSYVYGTWLNVQGNKGSSMAKSSIYQPSGLLGASSEQSCYVTDNYGLVDDSRDGYTPATDPDGLYGFANLATVYDEIKPLGPIIRKLNVTEAFANTSIPSNTASIVSVSGNKIEIGTFQRNDQDTNPDNYFMLVNRVCNNEDGTVSSPQNITVNFSLPSGSYEISDVASGNAWVVPNNGSFNSTFAPGEGKLFKITQAVSGDIYSNTTWSGNRLVIGTVTVFPGVTLTITPGTTVRFMPGTGLTIYGTLSALGTTTSNIIFTPTSGTTPGSWSPIDFEGATTPNSILQNCIVQYGHSIQCHNGANVTIDHCTLQRNGWGVFCDGSSPVISNNQILYNVVQGITVSMSNNVRIEGNTITYNNNNYRTGVWLYGSWGNAISNVISGYYNGLSSDNSSVLCGWSGTDSNVTPTRNNKLTGNQHGISSDHQSLAFMGVYDSGTSSVHGGNNWIENNVPADLGSYQASSVFGEGNWYGNDFTPTTEKTADAYLTWSALTTNPWGGMARVVSTNVSASALKKESSDIPASVQDDKNKSSEDKLFVNAVSDHMSKQYGKAETEYKQLLSSKKYSQSALVLLSHLGRESNDKSVQSYFEDLKTNAVSNKVDKSNVPLITNLLANMYGKQSEYNNAIALYDEVIKKYPNTLEERTARVQRIYYTLNGLKGKTSAKQQLAELLSLYTDSGEDIEMIKAIVNYPSFTSFDTSQSSLNKSLDQSTIDEKGITEYSLSSNYPNPFNPTTNICYQLPEAARVSLKVYDMLGREVAKLVDCDMEKGYHSATFDGSRLCSGIYFIRFIATPQNGNPPFTKTMKMLLTK